MMGDQVNNGEDGILDTDIVFDCTFCGKSLAIDYRAAGLSVPCSDCGKLVAIPIPDGMELTDLDSTARGRIPSKAAARFLLRELLGNA